MSQHVKACACKGIRVCAVCVPSLINDANECNEPIYNKSSKCFVYCTACDVCVRFNESNSNFFHNFLSNSIQNLDDNDGHHLHDCHETKNDHDFFRINGIFVRNEFVDSDEEKKLIESINLTEWKESQSGRFKQDYGPKVNFKKKKLKINEFKGLPFYSKFVIDRFKPLPQLDQFIPVELCNLKYESERAACIEPHIDDTWLWGDRLVTLNLMSNTFLTLTSNSSSLKNTFVLIPLKQRSLLVLNDEARYEWFHEIKKTHIKSTRLAINIRELSLEFMDKQTEEGRLGICLQQIALTFEG